MKRPGLIRATLRPGGAKGDLTFVEQQSIPDGLVDGSGIPFRVKRVYWITIPRRDPWHLFPDPWVTRGHHSHRRCDQVFFCLQGEMRGEVEDAQGAGNYPLKAPNEGLYVPALCWHVLHVKRGSIVLALASELHDEAEYIRDRKEWERLTGPKCEGHEGAAQTVPLGGGQSLTTGEAEFHVKRTPEGAICRLCGRPV